MNAVAHILNDSQADKVTDAVSLDAGAGTSLFVSGSAPTGTDMISGQGVGMFMQSVLETGERMEDGDKTGLYMQSV